MLAIILSMFMFALIGALSPGPVNIIATSSGASFGFRRTIPHVLGASIAYTLILFIVGLGLSSSASFLPIFNQLLRYIGSVFLLYMAYKIATSGPIQYNQITAVSLPPTALEGALSQGLNPKAWLVSSSGVSVFVLANPQPNLYLAVFCIISFTLCLFCISTWAAIGNSIRHLLSSPTRQRRFNIMMGVMLGCSVFSIL